MLPAAPAAADSLRLDTVTEHGVTGARVVYIGDERGNSLDLYLARNEDFNPEAPNPQKVIGFYVGFYGTTASAGPGCEITGVNEQLCRVPDGTRLLAPRAYLRGGNDGITIYVPRAGAIVYGGPGNDTLDGPYRADEATLLPGELHGGPGDDDITGSGLIYAGPGDDEMTGESSVPSRIVAGPGDDSIWGSEDDDVINAGPGHDAVLDWGGDDVIRIADGQTDRVACGGGHDQLIADGRDESDPEEAYEPFSDCEQMQRHGEPLLAPFEILPWDEDDYDPQKLTVRYACPPDGPKRCAGTVALRREGRLLSRRRSRERAGHWGYVEYPFSFSRASRLFDKELRVTIRWRGRDGHMRSLSKTDTLYRPSEPDDN